MPKFWVFLCQQFLQVPDHVAWAWWRALGKATWTDCAALRSQVLGFDALAHPLQQPGSDARLRALMAPGHLLKIVDDLTRQRLLLRRDGAVIAEAILHRLDREGEWR